jgi:hypothetical protein
VRSNELSEGDLTLLNSRVAECSNAVSDELLINLTTTNMSAEHINKTCLQGIAGKRHCFHAHIEGEVTKDYYPTDVELECKVGAQIMMLTNDVKKRWVNGTIGTIENVTTVDGEDVVSISFRESGRLVQVTRFKWDIVRFIMKDDGIHLETVGNFIQFPFRLAWAVTIHKSQGKTFDRVVIDLGRGAFASGQLYVALSRCTSFEGVMLKAPVRRQDIYVDPRIHRFLKHARGIAKCEE